MIKKINDFLYQPLSSYSAYTIACLFGILFIYLLFPIHYLLGDAKFFISGDPAQHVTGWWFYKDDTWHFPLLKTLRLNYPEGTSVIFTDSIPLLALLLKPFARWLPEHFHYIGLWHAFIFIFQAVAATYLIRTLQQKNLIALIAALILTLSFPPLLMRIGHTSLLTHGVLLLAFAFYWQAAVLQDSFKKINTKYNMLVLITLLIHAYLAAMILAFWLATCIDEYRKNKKISVIAYSTLILFSCILIEMYVMGYFISSNKMGAGGYGIFSMNLLAPFAPMCSQWFTQFCVPDATTGQYEGFNFLGIGAWIIIVSSLVLSWQYWRDYKPLRGLQISLVLLTLFALSGKIYIGTYLLTDFSMPKILADMFRTGGRFFWPVGYSLIFLGLLALLKYQYRFIITLIVAIALSLQLYQFSTYYKIVHSVADPTPDLNDLKLVPLFKNFEVVNIYPLYGCVSPYPYDFINIQYQAAYAGVLINTAYLARQRKNCEEKDLIFKQPLKDNNLYLALTKDNLPSAFTDAMRQNECVKLDDLLFCAKGKSFDGWKQHSAGLDIIPATP